MISTDIEGRKFGFLTAAYRDGQRPHRISCRCVCGRLVHVALEDLRDDVVNSCGCQPVTAAFQARQTELRRQLAREILFSTAMTPVGTER
jgi:hypothetical protein